VCVCGWVGGVGGGGGRGAHGGGDGVGGVAAIARARSGGHERTADGGLHGRGVLPCYGSRSAVDHADHAMPQPHACPARAHSRSTTSSAAAWHACTTFSRGIQTPCPQVGGRVGAGGEAAWAASPVGTKASRTARLVFLTRGRGRGPGARGGCPADCTSLGRRRKMVRRCAVCLQWSPRPLPAEC
jgi:hypothetical protein